MKFIEILALIPLRLVEKLFPLIPDRPRADVGDDRWTDHDEYYFLYNPDRRVWTRWKAVLQGDRNLVSFYRKREKWQRFRDQLLGLGISNDTVWECFVSHGYPQRLDGRGGRLQTWMNMDERCQQRELDTEVLPDWLGDTEAARDENAAVLATAASANDDDDDDSGYW